jgi:hypothetical protein
LDFDSGGCAANQWESQDDVLSLLFLLLSAELVGFGCGAAGCTGERLAVLAAAAGFNVEGPDFVVVGIRAGVDFGVSA